MYDKQIASLQSLYGNQSKEISISEERIYIGKKSLEHSHNFYKRDSILMEQDASSQVEFDKSKLNYLNTEAGFANARSRHMLARKDGQRNLQYFLTSKKICKFEIMQIQLDIGFDQLLKIVRKLPYSQLKQLKAEIEKDAQILKPVNLETLLLNGPVATQKQLENISNNRIAINQWRTK